MLVVAIAAVCLMLVWGFFVAPARVTDAMRAPFAGRMFAHRGLFAKAQDVPENSLAAFSRAVEAGYGIELDVQITSDGALVVFHDGTLERACGVPGGIAARTLDEVRALRLFGTGEGIPLFADVLSLVDGRVPLIVELKPFGDWRLLCQETAALLHAYPGDACIESFDPFLVRWFMQNAPAVMRGQLSEAYRFSHRNIPWYQAVLMSRLLSNAFTRPHFIAYRLGPKCLSARLCERLGAMRVVWTVHEGDDLPRIQSENDAIIFEHFTPERAY